jgi:CBS domain-containing protein
MPHSVSVSKLMIHRNEWPQLRADVDVSTAIKLLRIVTDDRKLEHGHSTPLVFDENYRLLGFIHLIDLLKITRGVWDREVEAAGSAAGASLIRDLVVPFAGTVAPEESIIDALNVMIAHRVSLVPVMSEGKLKGIVKLSDIFDTLAGLLFDEQDPEERDSLVKRFHW